MSIHTGGLRFEGKSVMDYTIAQRRNTGMSYAEAGRGFGPDLREEGPWLGLDMTTVETGRLVLRPWREEDETQLQRLLSDPAVRGQRHLPPERIAALAASSLRQWLEKGFGPWAAIDKATGEWIGRLGLDQLDNWPDVYKIEVGFELHQRWWGQGLATEGALAALRFGFEEHRLERIISVTAATNIAARRVMEKAGLSYQGTRHWMSAEIAVVWYAIDRTTWGARDS